MKLSNETKAYLEFAALVAVLVGTLFAVYVSWN